MSIYVQYRAMMDSDIPRVGWPCLYANPRDHFVCGLGQWETTLQCNVGSHWLSPYPKWSLQPHRMGNGQHHSHYNDVIMGAMASQITSLTIVYSAVYSDADQRKHQSSASLAFVWGIRRGPVNYPHKWPVTRKIFPFDDVIMIHPYPYLD